ncbi:hypothetical protein F5Y00DRAFT_226210 [Daldinia vernicosa]|uniref:uncharacterized protein n=1 Tax=Daldinia vernicosa TaxID=114800 RepID=UPI0020075378|nr:uncharacterized protein F5Y00DRAFT_226210 [Daldinia vernicosa]KAI0852841.1 hypothetical protein F5Y00DRAFT_226210 [Daldinia vernicosa]
MLYYEFSPFSSSLFFLSIYLCIQQHPAQYPSEKMQPFPALLSWVDRGELEKDNRMYVRGIKILITGNHFVLGNVPPYI